jgi:predicted kinase
VTSPLECVIMIGLPAAGKSTFARRHYPGYDYISKDAFPPSARDKQRRQDTVLRAALAAGRSALVDNTSVTPQDRAAIIAIAREFAARVVGVYVEAATREAIARNEARTGRAKVPKVAIFTCAKRLVPPQPAEGFDELRTVRVQPDGSFA